MRQSSYYREVKYKKEMCYKTEFMCLELYDTFLVTFDQNCSYRED